MSLSTPSNKRRTKPILSCTFCRGRKLGCDRQSPCSTCVRHGKASTCTYSTPEQDRRAAVDYRPRHARSRQQTARQRVAHLEGLVLEMRAMERDSSSPTLAANASDDGDPSAPTDVMGKLSFTDKHAVYTGSSHWASILEDIQCLKDDLSEEDSSSAGRCPGPRDVGACGAGVMMYGSPATRISLLNSGPCLMREQILAMLPARKIVDRHVSHFFNAFDIGHLILHRETFLTEYTNFWANPSTPPITWIGLLFSVMTMSAFLQQQNDTLLNPDPRLQSQQDDSLTTYRTITIHCLVAGDYLRPSRYTVSTLVLHFIVDQNLNLDTSIANWILMGVVIRVALRMGLHRDPSHWPGIPPLCGELRRSLWMLLYQMDFFTSAQVGLPRIVKDSQCDTQSPAHDAGDKPTSLLYIIQRQSIIKVAAEIYDATEAGPPSATSTAVLSAKLADVVTAIPEGLKYKNLETAIGGSPMTTLHRICLDVLTHKAVYLLHRRSLVNTPEGNGDGAEQCIQAALSILAHQRRISEEIEPGGLMFSIRWKVAASLSHEFLQATMLLCFAVCKKNQRACRAAASGSDILSSDDDTVTERKRDDILEVLAAAKGIWEKSMNQSAEARHAVEVITTAVIECASDKGDEQTPAVGEEPPIVSEEVPNGFISGVNQMGEPVTQPYSFDPLGFDFTQFGSIENLDPLFLSAMDGYDVSDFGSMLEGYIP
ncbi:fungal-specific transcription factor domain-containing protein [Apodospora peruviana]|uniref:Fungal-specific transcription factor domain-containing protein n=1 Tax=Apodospora peruviana TaxID=516989 RepID=A0AAE0IUA6_9PEZI|nr:fungal-specific transcription factor domain-containing protein [Apodospora peruviana]